MLRVLFLIIIVMTSAAFAQIQEKPKQNETPQALKVDELWNLASGDMKARIDAFLVSLMNDLPAKGYIIIYGSKRDAARRETFVMNYLLMRNIDKSKIKLINGGIKKDINAELWIVPARAEPPKLIPAPRKFDEFGLVSNNKIKIRYEKFLNKLIAENKSQGYIINYGTNRAVAGREKQLRDKTNFRCSDCPRLTFVRGGSGRRLKTIFWIVPEGAEPPIQ